MLKRFKKTNASYPGNASQTKNRYTCFQAQNVAVPVFGNSFRPTFEAAMADVEQKDIEVAREDQERINKFSRLNMKYDELDEEITTMKTEVQNFKDAVEEIEGCMEADGILMKVGEAYTSVEEDAVMEKLSKLIDESEASLSKKSDEIESVKSELDSLKKLLYGKFGSSINLEK